MTTRARLAVDDPETELSVGQFYEDTGYSGVSATTTESIRFYAHGDVASSDLIAQATGQVWLQAMENVNLLAKNKVVLSSLSATALAAQRGVTILCGFSPPSLAVEDAPGEEPAAVDEYDAAAALATATWAGFNALDAVTVALVKKLHTIVSGKHTWVGTEAAVTGVAGALLNAGAAAAGKHVRLPMVNVFSEGGIVGTAGNFEGVLNMFGSVGVTAGAGALLASPFTSCTSLSTVKVRGWLRAAVAAIGWVTISGIRTAGVTSDAITTLGARAGSLEAYGKTIKVGTPTPWKKAASAQLPTLDIHLIALQSISAYSPLKVEAKAVEVRSSAAGTTTMEATGDVTLEVGVFTIQVKSSGAVIGNTGTKAALAATSSALKLTDGLGQSRATFASSGMKLATAGGTLEVKPKATLKLNGSELKIG